MIKLIKKYSILVLSEVFIIGCGQENIPLTGNWTGNGTAKYAVRYSQTTVLGKDTVAFEDIKDSIIYLSDVTLFIAKDTFLLNGLDNQLFGKAYFNDEITPNMLSMIDLINHESYEYEVERRRIELESKGVIEIEVNAENAIRGEQLKFSKDTLHIWFSLGRSTDTPIEYYLKLNETNSAHINSVCVD